jgi:hypothetical protein
VFGAPPVGTTPHVRERVRLRVLRAGYHGERARELVPGEPGEPADLQTRREPDQLGRIRRRTGLGYCALTADAARDALTGGTRCGTYGPRCVVGGTTHFLQICRTADPAIDRATGLAYTVAMSSEKPPQTYILHAAVIGIVLVVALVLFLRKAWG